MYDSIALQKSQKLLRNINKRTGVNDLDITTAVNRFLQTLGNDRLNQNEVSTLLDSYPDPRIFKNESDNLRDDTLITINAYETSITFTPYTYAEFTGNQYVMLDFAIQGDEKFLIDMEMRNACESGVSNYNYSNNSDSILSTRTSNYIYFRNLDSYKVPNAGRGIFGKNYNTGECILYNNVVVTDTNNRSYKKTNPGNYVIGASYRPCDNSFSYKMTGKFYNLKVYNVRGQLIRNLYPGHIEIFHDNVLFQSENGIFDIIRSIIYPAPSLIYPE